MRVYLSLYDFEKHEAIEKALRNLAKALKAPCSMVEYPGPVGRRSMRDFEETRVTLADATIRFCDSSVYGHRVSVLYFEDAAA